MSKIVKCKVLKPSYGDVELNVERVIAVIPDKKMLLFENIGWVLEEENFQKVYDVWKSWKGYDDEKKQGEQKPTIEMITPEESLGIDSETYNKIVDECIYGEQKPVPLDENSEPILTDFESALFTTISSFWQSYNLGEEVNVAEFVKEHASELLEAANKQQKYEWSKKDNNMVDSINKLIEDVESENGWNCLFNYDGQEIKFEQIKYWLKFLKDRVLQQPKWSEEDERIYQSIIDDTVQENQLNGEQTDWLRSIKYRYFPQPQQECSEEDINMIRKLIISADGLRQGGGNEYYYRDIITWLEKLKYRILPQPQQEWSEEDEQISNAIVKYLGGSDALGVDLQSARCWVENVKDRVQLKPHWKPSDKQMEALKSSTYCQNEQMSKALFELYQDLKKLREK